MYAIYDSKGRILQSIECPAGKIEKIANGMSYIETSCNDATHYIENDQPVPFPKRPSKDHEFDYDSKQWVDTKSEEIRAQEAIDGLRKQRNALLYQSDWTQLPDAPVDKQAWAEYRQALRDITNQDPSNIVWPETPQ